MKPAAGNPVSLQITVDSTAMKTASPMGDNSPDLSGLTGKPFGMTLSEQGKETLAPEAASIQVDLGQMGGKRGVQADFADFFENLPAVPVRVGGIVEFDGHSDGGAGRHEHRHGRRKQEHPDRIGESAGSRVLPYRGRVKGQDERIRGTDGRRSLHDG